MYISKQDKNDICTHYLADKKLKRKPVATSFRMLEIYGAAPPLFHRLSNLSSI